MYVLWALQVIELFCVAREAVEKELAQKNGDVGQAAGVTKGEL